MRRETQAILGSPIDVVDWPQCLERVLGWARTRTPAYVCVCNTHSVVTARSDSGLRSAIAECDLAIPDGMPLTWVLRLRGYAGQQRINGPDLMLRLLAECDRESLPVFLFGGAQSTLDKLEVRLSAQFPGLRLAGSVSPPFRALSADEEQAIFDRINASGARVVFVALGCPKQEKWMSRCSRRVNAPMLGVGAAFDYHAGIVNRPPLWVQRTGIEWLGRLVAEPRRLWRRYLATNPMMLCYLAREIVVSRLVPRRK